MGSGERNLLRARPEAKATGAWGDPATILLTCGLDEVGPSAIDCVSIGGVDWLVPDPEETLQRAITFGRNPAVEVVVSREYGAVDYAAVLDELGASVSQLPKTGSCSNRPE